MLRVAVKRLEAIRIDGQEVDPSGREQPERFEGLNLGRHPAGQVNVVSPATRGHVVQAAVRVAAPEPGTVVVDRALDRLGLLDRVVPGQGRFLGEEVADPRAEVANLA